MEARYVEKARSKGTEEKENLHAEEERRIQEKKRSENDEG